jgi:hypothetical protein
VTSGHTGASVCAPEAGTTRTAVADVAARDVAPCRVPVLSVQKSFMVRFSKLFFFSFPN